MFNWCFIGTGKLATGVAKQLKRSGRHQIVSCFTRSFDKCQAFALEVGSRPYKSAIEAISDKDVDAVYIVTPHNTHYKYAKEALLLHKPVLVEKPFTVFLKDTEDLINLAKENHTYIAEAMWSWFSSPSHKIKYWIDNNKIGKVRSANFVWDLMISKRSSPRLFDPKRAGGALLDITIYPLTFAYRLFGCPKKIESKAVIKDGIDYKDIIVLRYDNNLIVNIKTSIAALINRERMVIKGEEGRIDVPFFHMNNIVSYKSKNNKEKYQGEGGEYFGNIISYLDEFDALENDVKNHKKESDLVPLNATMDVMKMIETIREQIGLDYKEIIE